MPALAAGAQGAVRVFPDGRIETLTRAAAAALFRSTPHLVSHAGMTARRLGITVPGHAASGLPAHAALAEFFAFVCPAKRLTPSAAGLADALGLPRPTDLTAQAQFLFTALNRLGVLLEETAEAGRAQMAALSGLLSQAGWPFASFALSKAGLTASPRAAFSVIHSLPEWEDAPPRGAPGEAPVSGDEAQLWLAEILGPGREQRPEQFAFAATAAEAFQPRRGGARVIAEAGTGVGKTLGYLSPATLWARRNDGQVWISTYTRNLQRQIESELERVFPDAAERTRRVAVLKGRENYLCLLNFEESASGYALAPGRDAVLIALVARWIGATKDGDFSGGDFPGWLAAEHPAASGLTDRRAECIYSACTHFRRCFIERNQRRAAAAEIVIANHALSLLRAFAAADDAGPEDGEEEAASLPRYVFDEGHHVFDAADSVLAQHLTLSEGAEMRRWILGRDAGGTRRGRARALRERLQSALAAAPDLDRLLQETERAASILPGDGWLARLRDRRPAGPFERFAAAVAGDVHARSQNADADYSLECAVLPLAPEIADAAHDLAAALQRLEAATQSLLAALGEALSAETGQLDASEAARLAAAARGLRRRVRNPLTAFLSMLADLGEPAHERFVDWFGVERVLGHETDAGYYRHFTDPSAVFAELVLAQSPGALITSATLRDRGAGEEDASWRQAELRTGAQHLAEPPLRARFGSPFDYAAQTRALVVTDVDPREAAVSAAALRDLALAAGGGALALFTSIRRLRDVHKRAAPALEQAGYPVFAQHADGLDNATLVDMFRAEEDSILFGTDAMRDGVDVPGRSLRLVVFDRTPWPRPDLLHKARTERLGMARYTDVMTRMRVAQAFGRLIRRASDKGVFVILGAATPSRVLAALPEGVSPRRVTLVEAVAEISGFLTPSIAPLRPPS